uniref:P-type ATPase C-terminal domain-containing protein n=1 Tax=Neolamprologus brichardi TaxID=32507 RepID=A0A3Q4H864_NEOBR
VDCQLNLYFSKKSFFKCALHSCYSSLVLFFIPYAAMYDTVRDDGKDIADYQSFALLTQTCLLFAVSIQMSYWTAVNTIFVLGSLVMYFAVTFTMYSNGMFTILPSAFPFIGTARNSLNQPNVWLTIFLTSILCVLPVITNRFLMIQLCPTINDKAKATPAPPTQRARIRRTSSRRSGYAFSHAQGYGDLVTSGRFLRRPALTRSSGFTHVGRTTTSFSPMGRSAGYSPTGRPQNNKVPNVEVTSLQMYRTITDSAP